ncbi:MAG TPA: transaldolase [Ktedonobacteraceae bacterium]|nr:transaldolase [Ktedonobacteraceae bacterium]
MTNPLLELKALGQSVWLDDIDRGQLRSGLFGRLVDEDGLAGATGNPTIFEHSITHDTTYDEQMQQLLKEGKGPKEIYEALAMTDERTVADLLRPIYDQANGQDGFVSIEVSPYLAHDTEGTLAEVRRFWHTIDRPNLMVKIPSTPAGVPAIRRAIASGININITLIFSLENYRQVAEAYLGALEEREASGKDISHIASVASFFVSRVDVLVDQLLEEKIKATTESAQQQQLKALRGRAAIANARLAYQEFKHLFGGSRFAALKQRGAHVQRPLWASTGAKNPAYRDVRYVEELVGPDTVNTMPLKTLDAFRDHGQVRLSIEENLSQAQAEMAALEEVGIHYDQVTRQLQEEGVQKFIDSFQKLFQCIESKQHALRSQEYP